MTTELPRFAEDPMASDSAQFPLARSMARSFKDHIDGPGVRCLPHHGPMSLSVRAGERLSRCVKLPQMATSRPKLPSVAPPQQIPLLPREVAGADER